MAFFIGGGGGCVTPALSRPVTFSPAAGAPQAAAAPGADSEAEESAPAPLYAERRSAQSGRPKQLFLVAPLVGWDKNTVTIPARGPRQPAQTLVDTRSEQALYTLYLSPRLAVTNLAFYTDPNQTEVSGDVFNATLYGDPESDLTWSAGFSYIWHGIDNARGLTEVRSPLVKAGPLFRFWDHKLSFNPYLGYASETIDSKTADSRTDNYVYGGILSYHYRMVEAALKYYREENLDTNQGYDVFNARLAVFFTRNWGALARYEYMEHSTGNDQSTLFGLFYAF